MSENTDNKTLETDEIDLTKVALKIWDGRKTIYKSISVFFILSLIITFGTPKEYKSEANIVVESSSSSTGVGGLLSQIGGLAGLNLGAGAGTETLTPKLYPNIIKSTPFLLNILNDSVTESKYDSTLKVKDYLERRTRSSLISYFIDYSFGLPFKIIGWIKRKPQELKTSIKHSSSPGPLQISQKESDLAESLSNRIKISEGETANSLIISVEMQDPMVAAQLADSVVKSLTKYIIDYRTQKAKFDLKFVEERHTEAEQKYNKAQQALANFQDQNQNIILASTKSIEQKLQAEYTLAFNVYNGISQQLEQSKIKVQEKTPVFKIINPATVPLKKSRPNTTMIVLTMLIIGGLIGVIIIFGKLVYYNFKNKIIHT